MNVFIDDLQKQLSNDHTHIVKKDEVLSFSKDNEFFDLYRQKKIGPQDFRMLRTDPYLNQLQRVLRGGDKEEFRKDYDNIMKQVSDIIEDKEQI